MVTAKFISLYLTLVLVSAVVLVVTKGLTFLDAVSVASLAAVFKTLAAHVHAWIWSKLTVVPQKATPQPC